MKNLRLLSFAMFLGCFLPVLSYAQGVFIPARTVTGTVNGITRPIAGATVTVCAANTAGIPCSPALANTVFKDSALTVPLANPFTTDANGNYPQAALAGGIYTITETAVGFAGFSYQATVACAPGAGCTISGPFNVAGAVTANTLQGVIYVGSSPYNTLSAALTALGTSPGAITLTPGTYPTASTITVGSGQTIGCTAPALPSVSVAPPITAAKIGGCIIQASGLGSNLPVINVHNAAGARIQGINVDCNNISGCINYLYDASCGGGVSTEAQFDYVGAIGGHFVFVAGLASNTADTNNCEADTFSLTHFQFYGGGSGCTDTTSEGILINSGNAANHSTVSWGNIQCTNIATRCVKTNGLLDLRNYNAGSFTGTTRTAWQVDSTCSFSPHLFNTETEGPLEFCVHDSSSGGTAANPTWMFNQWNSLGTVCQVLIDGTATVLSVGNQGVNTTFSVSGSGKVISIDETVWTPSSAITTLTTAGSTFGAQIKSLNYVEATATGNTPASIAAGDVAAVRGVSSGVFWFGSNGTASLSSDSAGNIAFSEGARLPEVAALSGGAGFSLLYANSTDHKAHGIFGNDIDAPLARDLIATSTAFATATTAGTCVQNTTAVSGAATSMAVSVSPVSTPGVGAVYSGFVSSAGNVTITECAVAASAGGTIAFNIRVFP